MSGDSPAGRLESLTLRPIGVIHTDVEDYEQLYLLFWLHQSTPPHNPAPFISPPRDWSSRRP
jgi:hypothetical protein